MPRIVLIQTGGTIDSLGADRLDLAWYIESNQRLAQGELVAGLRAETGREPPPSSVGNAQG